MNTLSKEILQIILVNLPIPDKKNLIRCTQRLHVFNDKMPEYEENFQNTVNKTLHIKKEIKISNNLEKYTLELTYYGYAHMIPEKYIIANNKILHWCPDLYFISGKMNFLEICKILIYCNKKLSYWISIGAATCGHLDLLKWARTNGCDWDSDVCANAAENGHLEVLKWARINGCEWYSDVCTNAAENGHLEILKWARENGCKWNKDVCVNAARNGHLEVLKWARKNGCDWNGRVCFYAARYGHFEIYRWSRENGCPLNGPEIMGVLE